VKNLTFLYPHSRYVMLRIPPTHSFVSRCAVNLERGDTVQVTMPKPYIKYKIISSSRRVPGYICKRRNDTDSLPMTPPTLPPVQGGCMSGFTRAPFSKFKYSCPFLSLMFHILNEIKSMWINKLQLNNTHIHG
jgi:hypothetical protein